MRGKRRHFTHSKVMAWVAFDRAIRSVEQFGHDGPVDAGARCAGDMHREVCERGYDAERGTFTQSYGSPALDAATLMIPIVGFLPPDDPRVIGTVEAVQRELCATGSCSATTRDDADDGLPPGRARSCPARSGSPTA